MGSSLVEAWLNHSLNHNVIITNTCFKKLRKFLERPYGTFIEMKSNLRRKKFIETKRAPIFLEAVLVIEKM